MVPTFGFGVYSGLQQIPFLICWAAYVFQYPTTMSTITKAPEAFGPWGAVRIFFMKTIGLAFKYKIRNGCRCLLDYSLYTFLESRADVKKKVSHEEEEVLER